ncbi:MAG: hypothetical protein RL219_908 [Actinomycetota bacterium]
MTSLWFGHLSGDDKVAVKPHASPAYHAIKYLTGELDRSYLTRLRSFGGLQAYPSRTKDPDVADFSTGSVGLGVVAPLFAAATRRYVEHHFGPRTQRPARFISLVGDAELDEGNVWEAVADPALQGLGNVMWIVDTNRQSLDRVVPDQKVKKVQGFLRDAGWHVVEAKYGRNLQAAFAGEHGDALKAHIEQMSNERYQSLFALRGPELRERFLGDADAAVLRWASDIDDDRLAPLVQNLGGHDLAVLLDAYRECDAVTDRPSVVFAYTIKGWGLPIAGDPLNHAALLSAEQINDLRSRCGLDTTTEWDRFAPGTPEAAICGETGGELNNVPPPPRPRLPIPVELEPAEIGLVAGRAVSTQDAFGRILAALASRKEIAERLVTTSPDVSVSTNLGGWINKVGVFSPDEQPDFLGDGRLLRWKQSPTGQHIELGISEMNLFLLLHALGLGHELHDTHLLPVGTVYDPFVCRGLDALIYALYNGARFVVVGTPSGITLAPEGGAHQSSITSSIGTELPGISTCEPAYARALDWILCDGLDRLSRDTDDGGESLYLRLSTRPVDQAPFAAAVAALGTDALRAAVLRGGYRLLDHPTPDVVLASCGPVVPEALAAAEALQSEGVAARVVEFTSADRLFHEWRASLRNAARHGEQAERSPHIWSLLDPGVPIVSVHDASSHSLAWIGSAVGSRMVPVGVDAFGQSGSIAELYGAFDLLPDQIVNAALVALG